MSAEGPLINDHFRAQSPPTQQQVVEAGLKASRERFDAKQVPQHVPPDSLTYVRRFTGKVFTSYGTGL